MSEQHDDHIWLTVGGEGWAIERIVDQTIYLWRGCWPFLERAVLDVSNVDWSRYEQEARRLLYMK